MNKRIDLTKLGGFPATQFTLDWMQESYRKCFTALAGLIGDKVIVSGLQISGTNASAGWISFQGELIPFMGGTVQGQFIITENTSSRLFQDGQTKEVYYEKIAQFGSPGFAFSDLARIGTLKDLFYAQCPKDSVIPYEGSINAIPPGWILHTLSRGRVMVGWDERTVGADPDFNQLGKDGGIGGAKTHVLSVSELPTISITVQQGDSYTGPEGPQDVVGRGAVRRETMPITSFGGNVPHNNLQPYYVIGFIKKVI